MQVAEVTDRACFPSLHEVRRLVPSAKHKHVKDSQNRKELDFILRAFRASDIPSRTVVSFVKLSMPMKLPPLCMQRQSQRVTQLVTEASHNAKKKVLHIPLS